ncbi:hypothetical protein EMCG_08224 [[Emmonsia] crescens]|uniref:Uncharacterized protein n=1 Tax=[Emmonsia] crescens TaxID=73230 RepID=A0A0G2I5V4_9EURO|nr:hypothetical protein EMCG_08224 [Emmonsia crescens UAMH 3008]
MTMMTSPCLILFHITSTSCNFSVRILLKRLTLQNRVRTILLLRRGSQLKAILIKIKRNGPLRVNRRGKIMMWQMPLGSCLCRRRRRLRARISMCWPSITSQRGRRRLILLSSVMLMLGKAH